VSARQSQGTALRVKYFRKLGRGRASFSVSIAEAPVVLASSLSQTETDRHAPEVIELVRRNREPLLDFWENGTEWPSDQVRAFLNGLAKIG
jgi:hypothetical protein